MFTETFGIPTCVAQQGGTTLLRVAIATIHIEIQSDVGSTSRNIDLLEFECIVQDFPSVAVEDLGRGCARCGRAMDSK